ncbi:CYTH and CHAD domain-containing protein [Sphingopyxis sp.]|uniref:CYTH and CHAD domain-containing protein n=1 Tax=Sphingopyxis sp. TaxID=1908224 RepID=UPI002FC95638
MADEVELKLELSRDAAEKVESSELLGGAPQKIKQFAIYFDTPDQHLAKAGFSLRIRRSGKKRIQTIKADGMKAAGLFVRPEWERPVDDDTPILDEKSPLAAFLGDDVAAIAPVFEVKVHRALWVVAEGEAIIEVVLDRGEVVAADRRSEICEIELELKSGDRAALFDLARKIDGVAEFRLGVSSKAERGYRLIGRHADMVKAAPVMLTGDMTAIQAFQAILQSCVRQFRLNETLLLADSNPGALHQARVALRRLRSAVTIFKPIIGDDGAEIRENLRWLASELAPARDLDVLLERAGAGSLHDSIAAARDDAYDRASDALSTLRGRRLMFDLVAWQACGGWAGSSGGACDGNQPATEFAAAALDRFRRRVKRRGRDIERADDDARHELRKSAKKLRYASEFFSSLFDGKRERRRYKRFVSMMKELQDQLGALNDLATAPDILARLDMTDHPEARDVLAGGDKKKLLEAAAEAHEDLLDVKRFW